MDFCPQTCDMAPAHASEERMQHFALFGMGLAVLVASEGLAAAAPTSTLATEADLKDAMSDLESKGSRSLSLELNPFMGIVGSGASGNVEYMPMRHLGLIASPRASLVMPAWAGE